MLNEKATFGDYGKTFQEGLVQLIFEDREFCDQITEVLDGNFLELEYLRLFLRKIVEYRAKYEKHPSVEAMVSILRAELESEDEVTKTQVREYYARIHTRELTEREYIKETSLDFCRKQNLKEAMIRSIPLLHKSSFDEISTLINDALKLGSENNFGYDYMVDFDKRFEPKFRHPITTGWKEIDKITGGGVGKSELAVVIASTGGGKSMVMVHMGAQALKENKTVIHYTLELQDTVVATRYDSCLTGYPLAEIINFKQEVYDDIKDIGGSLIIKEYPTKSASTGTIRSHLARLIKRGITPGMIIVDYADLLKPVINRKEKRNELESIYEELRAISTEMGCPVITCSQTNRTGINAEVITMEQISEAFNKCFVADLIVTISRTIKDKQNNTGKMYIAKNRNGPDGMVYDMYMDPSCVDIKVLPKAATQTHSSSPIANNVVPTSIKSQQELLKNKYAKLKRRGIPQ